MLVALLAVALAADIHHQPPHGAVPVGATVVAAADLMPCDRPLETCAGIPQPAGTRFVVTEAREPDSQPWLALSTDAGPVGWAPSAAVTPATVSTDLDGDGTPEHVVVRFTPEASVEVMLFTPGQPARRLDLGQRSDIEGPQETATVDILPASEAGIPLVRVRWHAREQCGSGDAFAYASFQGSPPVLREAWKHMGSGADAPIWWETKATFDPAKKTATTHFRAGEYENDGGRGVHTDETTVWTLRDGVFTKPAD